MIAGKKIKLRYDERMKKYYPKSRHHLIFCFFGFLICILILTPIFLRTSFRNVLGIRKFTPIYI